MKLGIEPGFIFLHFAAAARVTNLTTPAAIRLNGGRCYGVLLHIAATIISRPRAEYKGANRRA